MALAFDAAMAAFVMAASASQIDRESTQALRSLYNKVPGAKAFG
jgi:hypothetical protein